ncbi:PBP1A family penicillin-binding protein [Pelagibacteraceae bacterium]|nr:PBP1A family penicillin-binding protein [Pelagibacteraceae bacterium]
MGIKLVRFKYFFFAAIALVILASIFISIISFNLPDYNQLNDYKPSVMTRIHNSEGSLIKEYSNEYRVFIPIDAVPKIVKDAFISAEDKNFYSHLGVDLTGIARALIINIKNISTNKRPQGASTITQQVAKNFLLSDELSLSRKIKEAILAIKIETAFTKDRILELYLNQIYLGSGTYGIAAASNKYFKKVLGDLTIEEVAYLAALPKAPSNYHPVKNYENALIRRNWVLSRMKDNNLISANEFNDAIKQKLVTKINKRDKKFSSNYYSEEVRRRIIAIFGEHELYNGGLSVRTSLNSKLQSVTTESLQSGLLSYDKRHGYRGVLENIPDKNWYKMISKIHTRPNIFDFARIVSIDKDNIRVEKKDKKIIKIHLNKNDWLRKYINNNYVGRKINDFAEIFKVNDIIYISISAKKNLYKIEQIPKINGAVIVMDPYSGRVMAMSGGFDFNLSSFNRAVQAKRQPGSAFKPFVYLSALENGFQPNTMILDAPFVIDQGKGLGKWKPENYGKEFYGPSPLRKGIEYSRNLMTIRIAQYLGMDKISEVANRSGALEEMPEILSMALGAGETTLIDITKAYASFVNGGEKIEPIFIDKIQNRRGKNVFKANLGECINCYLPYSDIDNKPKIKSDKKIIFSPANAYQITSMLKGAVDRGTGRKTKLSGIEIAGKTGTTNNNTDAWFIGYTSDLIIGVYTGFDIPKSLGKKETGSSIAVPIFKSIMEKYIALDNSLPFRIPEGIELIQTNLDTGKISTSKTNNSIYEAYGNNDKLSLYGETLIGLEGFRSIQVDEVSDDIYLIY